MSRPCEGPRFVLHSPDRFGAREVLDMATGDRMLVYQATSRLHGDHNFGAWYFSDASAIWSSSPTSNGYPTHGDALQALITSQEAIHARLA